MHQVKTYINEDISKSNLIHDYENIICLFGIGELLIDCYTQLVSILGRKPNYICDNSEQKWGKLYLGLKCISPGMLAQLPEETLMIVTVRKYEGIAKQLKKLGKKNIYIVNYNRGYNVITSLRTIKYSNVPIKQNNIDLKVRGKWAMITGATRGIGRQIALGMAKLGVNIIAHSRKIISTRRIQEECSSFGVKTISINGELSNLIEVYKMLDNLKQKNIQIDILYNNAAISPPCKSGFWSISQEDYTASFNVNTLAPILICQKILPKMIERGFGRVINVTSSIQKRPDEMAYACSKAALDKFVHDLAPSLNDTGVMLSLLDPGWLKTDMGGAKAYHAVETVLPGALIPAIINDDINGRWISAQDYSGLDINTAIQKAKLILSV